MRLWSIHPKYLDAAGLVALWREALLAQAVLGGRTRGYRQHPQLIRFRAHRNPEGAIARYLETVADEGARRGYAFDRGKIRATPARARIRVTEGQLRYEWEHLRRKLRRRNPKWLASLGAVATPDAHPCFSIIDGDVEPWEKR